MRLAVTVHFFDPSSGMLGVEVENLLETLLRNHDSLDDLSAAKMPRCTPIRDAWIQDEKTNSNFASDGAFVWLRVSQQKWSGAPLSEMLGFEVQNSLRTCQPIRLLCGNGSLSKKGRVHPYQGCLGSRCKTP